MLTFQIAFGQDKSKLAFEIAIKDGFSTAPNFVVLTIKNLNNDQTKEIITDVVSVYEAFKIELNLTDYGIVSDFLLKNSEARMFELKNKDALGMLNFDNYELKSSDKIEKIIINECIADSLSKVSLQREIISDKFYEYSDQREEIIEKINDSISDLRKLTPEEIRILGDLTDEYYDYHYNEYVKISERGKQLMKIWNTKVNPFKINYKIYTDELERLEMKFFRRYYAKYGMNFCHLAFKYGVIFNSNCENGVLEFNQIIR